MYAITLVINHAMFQLLYKTEAKAREMQEKLNHNPSTAFGSTEWINVNDDFSQEITCERKHLGGYIFEDMEKTKLAHIERALHQQRMQNLAQKAASADPSLRMASPMNGPGIMSPFPMPPRN